MISFPPCKINIGLNVVSKRDDGFHNIETCFYPVPWTDILEIIPSDVFAFSSTGNPIPGNPDENLCLKAYQLLKVDFDLRPVKIHLHKLIPTGAGLGGGSSNAAHTIRLLNAVFDLRLTMDQLRKYASQLGSDCAFFLEGKSMIGSGRGEILQEVNVSLNGKFVVIVKPDIHISTAAAYAGITPLPNTRNTRDLVENTSFNDWHTVIRNDFEKSIFEKYPSIKEIKVKLYQQGAVYACMSGSGSAVFGLFNSPVELKDEFKNMIYWSGILA